MDWYEAESGEGMTHWFKPDDRFNKPGDKISVETQNADQNSLLATYRYLTSLRAQYPALRATAFQVIEDVPGCDKNCFALWTWHKDGQLARIVFNLSDKERRARVPLVDSAPMLPKQRDGVSVFGKVDGDAYVLEPWGYALTVWLGRLPRR